MTMTMTTSAPTAEGGTPRRRSRRRLLIVLGALVAALAGYSAWANLRPLTLSTTIEIDASPEQVWSVLAGLDAYAEWNPFIVSSSGELEVGSTLRHVIRSGDGTTTFTPTVLAVEPGRELRWIGQVPPGGIFDGEHSFTIEPLGPNRVRFTQSERFAGVAVPIASGFLKRDILPGFEAMNRALAERVARHGHV
jgi:hypothetical protein